MDDLKEYNLKGYFINWRDKVQVRFEDGTTADLEMDFSGKIIDDCDGKLTIAGCRASNKTAKLFEIKADKDLFVEKITFTRWSAI